MLASESTLTTARGDVESLRTDLERLRLELKEEQRDNRELRDQIKDWKRLEGKGQETRIRCTELEVELKVERERVADLEERLKVAKTWRKELKASKEEVEVLKTATNALRENAIRNDIVSPLKRRRDETEDEADEVEAVSRPSKKVSILLRAISILTVLSLRRLLPNPYSSRDPSQRKLLRKV